MSDPFRSFQQQPWGQLFPIAAITLVSATIIDYLLMTVIDASVFLRTTFSTPSVALILEITVGLGIGALSVYICERWNTSLRLNIGRLWALILCLIVCLSLKSWFPFPTFLVIPSYNVSFCMGLGVFWRGSRYF